MKRFRLYWQTFKTTPVDWKYRIPIGVGLGVVAFTHIRRSTNDDDPTFHPITRYIYTSIPFRSLSRWWGQVNSIELSPFVRNIVLIVYCNAFGVNLQEAQQTEISAYPHLNALFTRKLNMKHRPISQEELVSPVDGQVLAYGRIHDGMLHQVKGHTYALDEFIGEPLPHKHKYLCFIKIYLAPGDYHRFHSPADWVLKERRHFAGELFSVSPRIAAKMPDLFVLNERVALIGEWKYGFFSMIPVGATNVGSIRVHVDPFLKTNVEDKLEHGEFVFLEYTKELKKGEDVGMFQLGSTVIVVFEAPTNFEFSVGDRVKVGEALGRLK